MHLALNGATGSSVKVVMVARRSASVSVFDLIEEEEDIRHRGIDFRLALRECSMVFAQPPKSMIAPAIHGQEIIDLVSAYPDGIRMSRLIETVAKRFGSLAVFHTSARLGLDLDGLLESFEARNQVRIVRGVVYPG